MEQIRDEKAVLVEIWTEGIMTGTGRFHKKNETTSEKKVEKLRISILEYLR